MKKLVLTFACVVSLSVLYAAAPTLAPSSVAGRISTADSVDLNQYVGKYKFEGLPFDYITISIKDSKLIIDTGNESGPMTPVKDNADTFDASGRATLKFTRDANQKVTNVTLEAQGMSFYGNKEA